MTRHSVLATLLAASTVLAGAAYAADSPAAASHPAPSAPQESAARKAVDKDVVKLSTDGADAFRDMHLARVAIFNADPAQAKTLVGKAQAALGKARTDETAFTKAEADLKPPAAKNADKNAATASGQADATMPEGTKSGGAKPDAGATAAGGAATKPVAWLPVDGQLTLGEDFVATPQKSAAVSDANKSLAKGDQKGAAQTLKLAGIDVNFTMAVLPLDKTTSDVDRAAKLLDQGQYYEANAVLKQAEDGMRFDVVDVATPVAKDGTSSTAKTPDGQTPDAKAAAAQH